MGIEISPPSRERIEGQRIRRILMLLRRWDPILPRKKLIEGDLSGQAVLAESGSAALREQKKNEWLSKYSKELVDMALALADGWAQSMVKAWSPPNRPDIEQSIYEHIYPKAISNAESWLREITKG
ncbi:MAG: hypothetical protein QXI12_04125 [Candidatus Methanomethyliaceae archaeon]